MQRIDIVPGPDRGTLLERRIAARDRRNGERGGRRMTDRGGPLVALSCEGCGAPQSLQCVVANAGHLEYLCPRCRYRVFVAR
jgi:hypothetical protein